MMRKCGMMPGGGMMPAARCRGGMPMPGGMMRPVAAGMMPPRRGPTMPTPTGNPLDAEREYTGVVDWDAGDCALLDDALRLGYRRRRRWRW